MPELKASPRNKVYGLLADLTQGGIDFASRPFGYDNPPVRGLLAMTPAQSIANTLNELSYGGALGTGSGMTWKPKPDTVDAAMTLLPLGATAGKAAIDGGVALARRAAPAIERAVPRVMERGGLGAGLLQDLATGTTSNAVLPGGMQSALKNIQRLSKGEKVQPVQIARLTDDQFNALNALRAEKGFEPLPSKDVHYIGAHHIDSRTKDGYVTQDLLKQLMSGLDDTAAASMDRMGRTNLVASRPRYDGYASTVNDTVALIPSKGKTIAEAYSVIPKGDSATVGLLAKEKAGAPPGVVGGLSHNQRIEQNQPIPSLLTEQDVRNWIAQDNAVKTLGLRPDNTPMERAKAMGVDQPVYRGTSANEVSQNGNVWVTDEPRAADYYTGYVNQDEIYPMLPRHEGGNVMPLLGSRDVIHPENGTELWNGGNKFHVPASALRSRFAAFDPMRINENDLLGRASPGLLGLLAGGTGAGVAGYNWLTDR